jgi:hypothetical protein
MVTGLRKRLLPGLLIPALLLAPAALRAADKTVGVIFSGNLSYYQEVHKAFVKEMEKGRPPDREHPAPMPAPNRCPGRTRRGNSPSPKWMLVT